jgi:hypothetical protein
MLTLYFSCFPPEKVYDFVNVTGNVYNSIVLFYAKRFQISISFYEILKLIL